MKAILVIGSPNEHGCTRVALEEVAKTLNESDVETEFFHIGKAPIRGCIACGRCYKLGRCVFDDVVNEFADRAMSADGFVFGSPVYYSGMNGSLMSFLDRLFYSTGTRTPNPFLFKPAAAVVSARRAGTTSALDQICKYFSYQQMPIISSRYWNMVHGTSPEQVLQDAEGLQIMRVLGRNMAWFLKLRKAGDEAGVPLPEQEAERISTNFVR